MTREKAENELWDYEDEGYVDYHRALYIQQKIYDGHEAELKETKEAATLLATKHLSELKAKDNRIAELEAMVEETKCCGNCGNTEFDGGMGSQCKYDDLRCEGLSHWQPKDNK